MIVLMLIDIDSVDMVLIVLMLMVCRPQILVFSGAPHSRPALVDFASNISKGISLLICGHVVLPVSVYYISMIYLLLLLLIDNTPIYCVVIDVYLYPLLL